MIDDDTATFDIGHEDWGFGTEFPYVNRPTISVSNNEMRLRTIQDNLPDGSLEQQMILTGPLRLDTHNRGHNL